MQNEYVVLEGKIFVVELLSYLGSTNYGWCISKLPEEIIVMGTENVSVGGNYNTTLLQRFYFGVVSKEEQNVDISFTLRDWSNLNEVADDFTAKVKICKSDSAEFASYSGKMAKVIMPYGLVCPDNCVQNSCQDYGLPYDNCSNFDCVLTAYGVPDNTCLDFDNIRTAYGVPRGFKMTSKPVHTMYGVPDLRKKF
ncbi:MAG: hypothetical protein NC220_06545 [Clostridium sp.]|nr:hypothetical protein [Clostridium sp.]